MIQKTQRAMIHIFVFISLFLQNVLISAVDSEFVTVQILTVLMIIYMSDVLSDKRLYLVSLPLTPDNKVIKRGMWACLPLLSSDGSVIPQ